MVKAYDLSDIAAKLQDKGIVIAEDAAYEIVNAVFAWLEESADMSENMYDNMFKTVYPLIKGQILLHVDKIDGQEG